MSLPAAGIEETSAIRPRRKFEGHASWVKGIIHLPGEQRIMTCALDGSLRVWNLESGVQIGKDWRDGEHAVITMALSPDGKRVVSGSGDGAVRLWDLDTGKVVAKWTPGDNTWTRRVLSVCWNRDGGRVVSGSDDGTATVWDVEKAETILAIETGLIIVEAVIYSPDETMIATGGVRDEEEPGEEFIKIWDTRTGDLLTSDLKGHNGTVYCLAWTEDQTTLISGSIDHSIRMWNTTTWQQTNVLTGHTGSVNGIAISPSGILASASWDKTARLWDIENGQSIGSSIHHENSVTCTSFSKDGKLLATGCMDNNTHTWDVSAIVGEVGLNEALLNSSIRKPLLFDGATRRPGQRLENAHRIPPGFFDDSPHHRPSGSNQPLQSSTGGSHHAPGRTLFGRASSLFQRTTPGPRALDWVRNQFSGTLHRRNDDDTELHARRPVIVDVPFTKGKRRNISAAEIRLEREKAKKKKKKPSAGSSQPHQSIVTQQSGGAVQAQPGLVPTSTPLTTPTAAATSAATMSTTSRPDVMITQPGCWTRFWLFTCCASTQYTDGHH